MRTRLLRNSALLAAAWVGLAISGCVVVHSNFPADQEAASRIAPFGTIGDHPTSESPAELAVFYSETYAAAAAQLRNAARSRSSGWAVILDTDDVVLDANLFPGEVTRTGRWGHYEYWMDWAKSTHASVFPGAGAFINAVHELGGHVIIVTDHLQKYCGTTRARLAELGIDVDAVLCAERVNLPKDTRFDAIRKGAAVPGIGPLEIAMYLGSELSDFPKGSTDNLQASEFGVRLFLLPDFKGR